MRRFALPEVHRILIVDDEPEIVRIVARTLRRAGYTVLEACSGAEGLALVSTPV